MDIKHIVVILMLVLLVFFFGAVFGWYYSGAMNFSAGPKTPTPLLALLDSKVIPSLNAYGTIKSINGRSVTLEYQGDSATVVLNSGATIYSFKPGPGSKEISFSDVKVGDNASIALKILSDGTAWGSSLIVLPAPAATKK